MKRKAKIYYTSLDDFWRKEEKLDWLRDNHISKIKFERIESDSKHNWINQTDNDFETLLPLIDKDVKLGRKNNGAIFQYNSLGLASNRDEWSFDFDYENQKAKSKYFCDYYSKCLKKIKSYERNNFVDNGIKWTSELVEHLFRRHLLSFDVSKIRPSLFRPFVKKNLYFDRLFTHRIYQNDQIFGVSKHHNNLVICVSGVGSSKNFQVLCSNKLVSLDLLEKTQCLSLYVYFENQKQENITDWALNQFQTHYEKPKGAHITKQDIFYYTYAVLHSPQYRKKYEQNLKREFPRLPFYEDFTIWRDWGEELMDLHVNYETQEPFALGRKDLDLTAKSKNKQNDFLADLDDTEKETFISKPRTKLRADKANGTIEIDSHTQLTNVPALAWEYRLGNRSALEWILDQYKEKKPSDATIAERFNTYKFADYKEQVIDLLKRVTGVSVKTMGIINRMPNE